MDLLINFSELLGSVIVPLSLITAVLFLLPQIPILHILSPKNFISSLRSPGKNKHKSKKTGFQALTIALAGTLGVGNITGVASALVAGGPGAVFWMNVGAFFVLIIKYAEVYLAVIFRKRDSSGWAGGAMYYISYGLQKKFPPKVSSYLGAIFAILCCANSLITGNIVQSNAASTIFPENKHAIVGILLASSIALALFFGISRIEKITVKIIPTLAVFYILVSFYILLTNLTEIPSVISDIVTSAFSLRAVCGSAVGFTVQHALRFGLMRGILSNEAGCGTSPTAHASAETDSPHKQACLGIVEVLVDTPILCSLTALVILISDRRHHFIQWGKEVDSAPLALDAFRSMTCDTVYYLLIFSIVLFAFATILAQLYYGTVAIKYLTNKKGAIVFYNIASLVCTVVGSVISAPTLWLSADLIIGIMTVFNSVVLILLRKHFQQDSRKESHRIGVRRLSRGSSSKL